MLIGVSGRRGSGKTTLATQLAKTFPRFELRSFATPLKRLCADLFPAVPREAWYGDDEKKMILRPELNRCSGRHVLQQVGGLLRSFDENVWVNAGLKQAIGPTIFDDVRFPNEVTAIQRYGGVVIRLARCPYPDDPHLSERALDRYCGFDFGVPPHCSERDTFDLVMQFLRGKV